MHTRSSHNYELTAPTLKSLVASLRAHLSGIEAGEFTPIFMSTAPSLDESVPQTLTSNSYLETEEYAVYTCRMMGTCSLAVITPNLRLSLRLTIAKTQHSSASSTKGPLSTILPLKVSE